MDKFQNSVTATAVERVLKLLAAGKAQEMVKVGAQAVIAQCNLMFCFRTANQGYHRILSSLLISLPSVNVCTSTIIYSSQNRYLALGAHPALPEEPSTGDQTLKLALEALDAADYPHAVSFINEAIDQGISFDIGRAEALNLRGTFKFLTGDIDGARADLEESVAVLPGFTQSLVKIASVYMEQGDPKAAFECFDKAIGANPSDPDIYYHRGQVLFIMNEFEEAAQNYEKSTELDDQFVFSHIQYAVAQYKLSQTAKSMATFRKTLRSFPIRSEPYNY